VTTSINHVFNTKFYSVTINGKNFNSGDLNSTAKKGGKEYGTFPTFNAILRNTDMKPKAVPVKRWHGVGPEKIQKSLLSADTLGRNCLWVGSAVITNTSTT